MNTIQKTWQYLKILLRNLVLPIRRGIVRFMGDHQVEIPEYTFSIRKEYASSMVSLDKEIETKSGNTGKSSIGSIGLLFYIIQHFSLIPILQTKQIEQYGKLLLFLLEAKNSEAIKCGVYKDPGLALRGALSISNDPSALLDTVLEFFLKNSKNFSDIQKIVPDLQGTDFQNIEKAWSRLGGLPPKASSLTETAGAPQQASTSIKPTQKIR